MCNLFHSHIYCFLIKRDVSLLVFQHLPGSFLNFISCDLHWYLRSFSTDGEKLTAIHFSSYIYLISVELVPQHLHLPPQLQDEINCVANASNIHTYVYTVTASPTPPLIPVKQWGQCRLVVATWRSHLPLSTCEADHSCNFLVFFLQQFMFICKRVIRKQG